MPDFNDYDELNQLVKDNGDVLSVTMFALRNAHGADRLGSIVRDNISKKLKGFGLSHYPPELPASQSDHAVIFRLGTPVSGLIRAVIKPSPDTDDLIRNAVESNEKNTLDKIRELLEI